MKYKKISLDISYQRTLYAEITILQERLEIINGLKTDDNILETLELLETIHSRIVAIRKIFGGEAREEKAPVTKRVPPKLHVVSAKKEEM